MNLEKRKNLEKFLIVSVLGIILINLPLISALIINVYAKISLSPGENYRLNIPFIGQSKNPSVCGVAEKTDGTLVEGVKVTARSGSIFVQNTTNSDGEYCLSLPEINKTTDYNISIDYDNSTLTLANNDYDLSFDNNKVYRIGINGKAYLSGDITNRDAPIENGRFEIELGQKINGSWKYNNFGGYREYLVNINPNEIYEVPNEDLDFSWDTASLGIGEYKFLFKSSFNGKEKSGFLS